MGHSQYNNQIMLNESSVPFNTTHSALNSAYKTKKTSKTGLLLNENGVS